jgi:hypothetical protein
MKGPGGLTSESSAGPSTPWAGGDLDGDFEGDFDGDFGLAVVSPGTSDAAVSPADWLDMIM